MGAGAFQRGMHRKLSQTDIDGGNAYLARTDGSERSSASFVRTVGKSLIRYPGFVAGCLEQSDGKGIGSVTLAGAVFDYDSFVRA